MAKTSTRTKRSGSQLSADVIIEACLRIAARGSDDAFTVRRLGQELGADPTAVYRYFRDKDELLLSVADRAFDEVLDSIPPGLEWKDRLRALAEGSLAMSKKYPIVASKSASRITRRINEFRIVEMILGAITEAGLEGADAVLHYRVFGDSMLSHLGMMADYALLPTEIRAADESSWAREYRMVDPGDFPAITRVSAELPAVTDSDIYRVRLESIIAAIEARGLATQAAKPSPPA